MEMNTSLGQGARAACAECGTFFAVEDMIRHGAAFVCAKCKPIFLQKLAEGAPISSGQLRYAGFWRRVAALFVDGIALLIAAIGLGLVFGLSASQTFGTSARPPMISFVQQFLGIATGILYETILIGRFGATLGKMALKIHVVTGEGGRVSYLRALGRYFAKFLSAFTLGIGYLMAAFDGQSRALHDRICNTRVVAD